MVKLSRFISELDEYIITPQDVWSCNAPKDLLKLDWNESPCDFDYYQKEAQKIVNLPGVLSWYPDCLALELNNELSNYLNLDGNLILTFPGSDVGLESICRAYLEPDENVVVVSPTYENFYVYVLQNGANLHRCHLDPPFSLSHEYLSNKIKSIGSVKIVYLTRPNNPCGYLIDLELIENIAKKFPDTLFIIDEAYIEFTDEKSCVFLIKNLNNIVVTRTFSKAFGLAGIRLGYVCGSFDVICAINKIRNGKNISMISQKIGIFALKNVHKLKAWVSQVVKARRLFEFWCEKNGITYYPSHGNFVLFKVSNPNEICSELKAKGVYIRNRTSILSGCLRVTVGSTQHVKKLISILESLKKLL